MTKAFKRITRLLIALIAACMAWMVVEMMRGSSSHYLLHAGAPNWALVITPGRPIYAFYVFLVVLTLIPPVCCLGLILSGGSQRLYSLYAVLTFLGVSVASCAAGFGYEALRSEIRLSGDRLSYRTGSETAQIRWPDVGVMVLRWRRRSQSLELMGRADIVRIDLSTFAVPDQVLLVQNLRHLAHLTPLPHRRSDEWVWRRTIQTE